MLYQIGSDYYVKVGNKFAKISISVDKEGELVLTPTTERLENNGSLQIRPFSLETEKETIKANLKRKDGLFDKRKSMN